MTGPEPLTREWLVTNGLGGYASGTLSGACTRRYHGLLVAALPAPLGRVVMLNHLAEEVRLPGGRTVRLGFEENSSAATGLERACLGVFALDGGLPVWTFDLGGAALEKRVLLPHGQNTVHVRYRFVRGEGPLRLRLRPSVHFRGHEAPVDGAGAGGYVLRAVAHGYEVESEGRFPALRLAMRGPEAALVHDGGSVREVYYRAEHARGYESSGHLYSPGYFRVTLPAGGSAVLVASTESWDAVAAIPADSATGLERERRRLLLEQAPAEARIGTPAQLVLAADQFLIVPQTRAADAARVRAAGDEARTVIAGYHWFTDWGRDTMISLEGLTLRTGRHAEAGSILRTFGRYVRDGLLPNLFPEGEKEGLYHTADATLWFFHALDRYLAATDDRGTLRQLLPVLRGVVAHHLRGTRYGIGVDPADGLLRQGAEGYQLTWMDAKVDGWVVTPRRGKAVEINALWYNALRLLERWEAEEGGDGSLYGEHAARARRSFNARFWDGARGHLLDVVDAEGGGDDPALRPNQVLAVSLPHPVLDHGRWAPVVETVARELLTPVGLRSLARGHPDYKRAYDGDLRARDAAYHQGTVWAWLIGPFVDAWLKVHPGDRAGARRLLRGFEPHLGEAGQGTISEVFDAEPPYTPRGCIAQAWSVAEVLRAWLDTGP